MYVVGARGLGRECCCQDVYPRQAVYRFDLEHEPLLDERLRQLSGVQPEHCQASPFLDNSSWDFDLPVARGLIDFCLQNLPQNQSQTVRTGCPQELPVDLADYFAFVARQGSWLGPLEVQALAYITGFRVVLVPQLSKLSAVVFNKSAPHTIVLWHDGSHIDLVVPTDLHQGYPARFLAAFHAKHWWFQAGGGGLDEPAKAQVQAMIQQCLQQALASINWTEIISRAMPQQAPPSASQDVPMPQSSGSAEQGNEQVSGRRKRKKPSQAQTEQAAPAGQQSSKGAQGKNRSVQVKGTKGGSSGPQLETAQDPPKPPKTNAKGKGQGGDGDGWTKVQRKGQETNVPFELRAQLCQLR